MVEGQMNGKFSQNCKFGQNGKLGHSCIMCYCTFRFKFTV